MPPGTPSRRHSLGFSIWECSAESRGLRTTHVESAVATRPRRAHNRECWLDWADRLRTVCHHSRECVGARSRGHGGEQSVRHPDDHHWSRAGAWRYRGRPHADSVRLVTLDHAGAGRLRLRCAVPCGLRTVRTGPASYWHLDVALRGARLHTVAAPGWAADDGRSATFLGRASRWTFHRNEHKFDDISQAVTASLLTSV